MTDMPTTNLATFKTQSAKVAPLLQDVFSRDSVAHSRSVFYAAVASGKTDIVDYLIREFVVAADQTKIVECPNNRLVFRETCLWRAASDGNERMVRKLLALCDSSVDATCHYVHTPLSAACWFGHVKIAKVLLDSGAAMSTGTDRLSPLMLAVITEHTDVARLLVKRGASVNFSTANGSTALHWSTVSGKIDCTAFVCDKGAAYVADASGTTPAMWAAQCGNWNIVTYLGKRFRLSDNELFVCNVLWVATTCLGKTDCMAKVFDDRRGVCERIDPFRSTVEEIVSLRNRWTETGVLDGLGFVNEVQELVFGNNHHLCYCNVVARGDVAIEHGRFELAQGTWRNFVVGQKNIADKMFCIHKLTEIVNRLSNFAASGQCPGMMEHFLCLVKQLSHAKSTTPEYALSLCNVVLRVVSMWLCATVGGYPFRSIEEFVRQFVDAARGIDVLSLCLKNTCERLPVGRLVRLLCGCGAPTTSHLLLHSAVIMDRDDVEECVSFLLEQGCHPDFTNEAGKTPADMIDFRPFGGCASLKRLFVNNPPSLRCVCARKVSRDKTLYDGCLLPKHVLTFVANHSPVPVGREQV